MSARIARNRAAELAKHDSPAALREARAIAAPWYRAQALAYVARFAPEKEIESIAGEALDACRACSDAYRQLAGAAWPLSALVERGCFDRAREALAALLDEERHIRPASSRSEALFLLYQACFHLDVASREALARRLAAAHREARHWRSRRNLIDALAMLRGPAAAELAADISAAVDDERVRSKLEAFRRSDGRRTPRAFCS